MTSGYCLMCDLAHFGVEKGRRGMIEEYYSLRDFRKIMQQINYAPNGAGRATVRQGRKNAAGTGGAAGNGGGRDDRL